MHAVSVWSEIDTNIGGLVQRGQLLIGAGLGASRGLLIVGAPGVGKTALWFTSTASVLTVATTNVLDAVDPALIRAGRFDAVIETGADLREVVLENGSAFTTADLLDVVATGRWKPILPTGQYL